MGSVPRPWNDRARVEALRGYEVLDTAPEQSFEDVTQLAAQICGTPVAVITLVDEERLWFKSEKGLGLTELDRELGFCSRAILQPELMIVPDATTDARFQEHPLVTGAPGIRFYAGAPLIDPRGFVLGTVCVIDFQPREMPPEQARALEMLARQVIGQLELRRMNREQRRLIEELRASTERFESFQRATNDVIWDWDLRTDRITLNTRITDTLGYSPESVGADSGWWLQRFHPEDQQRVLANVRRMLEEGLPLWTDELRFLRAEGSWVRLLNRGTLQRDADGKPLRVFGVAVDLSEREDLRARLSLADRMTSVGTLAAGVAHEINNPLAYVMANLDYAIQEAQVPEAVEPRPGSEDLAQALQEAREGAERIRLIVRDLKTFSRPADERTEQVDPHRALDSAVTMAWNEIRHRARLVKDYQPVPLTYANEGRLGQVFLNLLVNAAHAIPEGAADQHEIRLSTSVDAEGRIVAEVRDSGRGIPEAIRARILEPFFTTKPVGEGTGLGLSICHSLITQLGGELSFDSVVGRGTTFRVVLLPADRREREEAPVAPVESSGRRGRILVVDDEPRVLAALERHLGKAHELILFNHAEAALVWLERGLPWDLILCDVMMPELTGVDFHETLSRRMPERAGHVIFLTGGAFTPRAREFLDRVDNPRLDKPFDFRALHALVAERLRAD